MSIIGTMAAERIHSLQESGIVITGPDGRQREITIHLVENGTGGRYDGRPAPVRRAARGAGFTHATSARPAGRR